MNPQRKFVQHRTTSLPASSSGDSVLYSELLAYEVLAPAINIHGLRVTAKLLAQRTGPTKGILLLICAPATITGPAYDQYVRALIADFTSGVNPEHVWASAPFLATTGIPDEITFEPKTSRNCPKGSNLILLACRQGVSDPVLAQAGMTFFSTS